jgi:hypothetical protein
MPPGQVEQLGAAHRLGPARLRALGPAERIADDRLRIHDLLGVLVQDLVQAGNPFLG